jgi:hypothetical protein
VVKARLSATGANARRRCVFFVLEDRLVTKYDVSSSYARSTTTKGKAGTEEWMEWAENLLRDDVRLRRLYNYASLSPSPEHVEPGTVDWCKWAATGSTCSCEGSVCGAGCRLRACIPPT